MLSAPLLLQAVLLLPQTPYTEFAVVSVAISFLFPSYFPASPPVQVWQSADGAVHFYHDADVDEYVFRALGLYHTLISQIGALKATQAVAWGQFKQDVCTRLEAAVQEGASAADDQRTGLDTVNLDDARAEEMRCPKWQASSPAARKIAGSDVGRLPDSTLHVLTHWFEAHLRTARGPYPDNDEKDEMILKTAITIRQLDNWFTNKRRRDKRCKRLRDKWTKN